MTHYDISAAEVKAGMNGRAKSTRRTIVVPDSQRKRKVFNDLRRRKGAGYGLKPYIGEVRVYSLFGCLELGATPPTVR
jgi:hypothetical protein